MWFPCLLVLSALSCGAQAVERVYYIQAEEEQWDYAPSGCDLFHGLPLSDTTADTFFGKGENSTEFIGGVYKKAIYHQYTDRTYTERVPTEEWLGYLGPPIRAEVSDTIKVIFKNHANNSNEFGMHPHGVKYTKENEGARYNPYFKGAIADSCVSPGGIYEYTWEVPDRAGPTGDDDRALWMYHSHCHEVEDEYSGLVGPLIIYNPGTLNSQGKPSVREFVVMLEVGNENMSPYITDNCDNNNITNCDTDDEVFEESNLMHHINGRMFGNLDGLVLSTYETVVWLVAAFGTEVDLHTAHWHGNTLVHNEHNVDTVMLLPATFQTLKMTPDAPGTWLLHCHVNDHITAGMIAYYEVVDRVLTDADVFRPSELQCASVGDNTTTQPPVEEGSQRKLTGKSEGAHRRLRRRRRRH